MANKNPTPPLCACGCGTPVTISRSGGTYGQWNTWVHGHHARGSNNPHYRGGIYRARGGYIYVRRQGHPRANPNGYMKRAILVAEEMIGRALQPSEEVHHKNRNTSDDRPSNLQVITRRNHTLLHLADFRTEKEGERNPAARLTVTDVRSIREARGTTLQRVLAERHGVSKTTISSIQLGHSWKHVPTCESDKSRPTRKDDEHLQLSSRSRTVAQDRQ